MAANREIRGHSPFWSPDLDDLTPADPQTPSLARKQLRPAQLFRKGRVVAGKTGEGSLGVFKLWDALGVFCREDGSLAQP